MPQAATDWTPEMVWALPDDGQRYECVDGELFVTPSPRPRHQRAVSALEAQLRAYVRAHGLGELLHSPADIRFDPHTVVQPDLFVLPLGDASADRWPAIANLVLAVEVLSPSTARADRVVKRRRYQRAAVPEYWIVDLDARVVERWRPGDERAEVVSETLLWRPRPELLPLELDLTALFADVLDAP